MENKKKVTSKQVVAIIGIILLVLLYIGTLLISILGDPNSNLFLLCIIATIFIPMLIWIYTWLYGKLTGKHTFTDMPDSTTDDTTK